MVPELEGQCTSPGTCPCPHFYAFALVKVRIYSPQQTKPSGVKRSATSFAQKLENSLSQLWVRWALIDHSNPSEGSNTLHGAI